MLRSRLLLPADPAASRLLVGRATISAAADWLERRTQLERGVFARGLPEAGAQKYLHRDGTPYE